MMESKISNNTTVTITDLKSFFYSALKRDSSHQFRVSVSVAGPCPRLSHSNTIILQAVKFKPCSPFLFILMYIHEHTGCSSLIWYPPAQAVLHLFLQSRLDVAVGNISLLGTPSILDAVTTPRIFPKWNTCGFVLVLLGFLLVYWGFFSFFLLWVGVFCCWLGIFGWGLMFCFNFFLFCHVPTAAES